MMESRFSGCNSNPIMATNGEIEKIKDQWVSTVLAEIKDQKYLTTYFDVIVALGECGEEGGKSEEEVL